MNLVIISASQRKQSQTVKVVQYMAEAAIGYENIVHLELCQLQLPLWDGEQVSKLAASSDWLMINKHLQEADAFIVITPEWSGMASPLLKNLLMMCEAEDTGHKPALLVSVVNGISGAYPIAELRMNAFKNNKLVAIPDHLIIRNVEEILNADKKSTSAFTERDAHIRHRIGYSLHTLQKYSSALKTLRAELINQPYENEAQYSYGM
ncbi:NADPH-dependent FMN reductase [Colwellia sp. 39_35_sub15_T18]|nr:NADPH-dependent FMN reductase [Colwellia sp. 39_35_sub15_T18]